MWSAHSQADIGLGRLTFRSLTATALVGLACVNGCSAGTDNESATSTAPRHADQAETDQTGAALCPIGGPLYPSCYGHCGFLSCSPAYPSICCSCDAGCVDRGDCCCDYEVQCEPEPEPSCAGHCGGMAPEGCFCDAACVSFMDCCGDYQQQCDAWPKVWGHADANGSANAVAVDPTGQVYAAAHVASPWDFGDGTPVGGPVQAVIASWQATGAPRWTTEIKYDSVGGLEVTTIEADSMHVYVAGQSSSPIYVAGFNVWDPPPQSRAPFVLALSSVDGSFSWAHTYAAALTPASVHELELAPSGNLAVAGLQVTGSVFNQVRNGFVTLLKPNGTQLLHAANRYFDGFGVDDSDSLYSTFPNLTGYITHSDGSTFESTFQADQDDVWTYDTGVANDGVTAVVGWCPRPDGCEIGAAPGHDGLHPLSSVVASFTATRQYRWSRGYPLFHVKRVRVNDDGQLAVIGIADDVVDLGAGPLGAANRWSLLLLRLSREGTFLGAEEVAIGLTADARFYHPRLGGPAGSTRFVSDTFTGTVSVRGQTATAGAYADGFVTKLQ